MRAISERLVWLFMGGVLGYLIAKEIGLIIGAGIGYWLGTRIR